jgi:hypothetical protein
MKDVDRKEDTELSGGGLTLSRRERSVESLGQCQSVGNPIASDCIGTTRSIVCKSFWLFDFVRFAEGHFFWTLNCILFEPGETR